VKSGITADKVKNVEMFFTLWRSKITSPFHDYPLCWLILKMKLTTNIKLGQMDLIHEFYYVASLPYCILL
jgi:hypothetical protein